MHLSENEQIASEIWNEHKRILEPNKIIHEARAAVTERLVSNPLVRTCTTDVMFVMGKTLRLCNVLKADESAICLFQFNRNRKSYFKLHANVNKLNNKN